MRHRGVPFRMLAIAVAVLALGAVAATAYKPPGYYPPIKRCGSFKAHGYRIRVDANRYLSCRGARRIMKAYWHGKVGRDVIAHNGGAGASGYYTLRWHPGWRCYSGSGGGNCWKRRKVTDYQN